MLRVFRWASMVLILAPFLFFLFGLLFWMSSARPDGFFLFEAIRARSAISLWLSDHSESGESRKIEMSVFAWLRPSRTDAALSGFDEWFREYLLLSEDTDESADGAPYILPPAIIRPFQIESEFEPDQYDSVTRQVIENIWNSGLFSLVGFIKPEADVWLKSLLGWHSAGIGLESLTKTFGLNQVTDENALFHPFLLNWLNRQPSAELERESFGGVTVFESVIEINADEFFKLYGKLCGTGALPDLWCSEGSFIENPLDPLLKVSPDFRVQLKYFWTVRGGALLWSNQKECLISAFAQSGDRFADCSDQKSASTRSHFEGGSMRRLRSALTSKKKKAFGYFVNEQQILFDFAEVVRVVSDPQRVRSKWFYDLLIQANFVRELKNLSSALTLRSQVTPYWGARLVEHSPGSLELLTIARWMGLDDELDRIHRPWAESQFEFLYSFQTAWSGLPRTPARLRQNGPWQQSAEFRQSKSVFEVGWSEKE